MTFGSTFGRTFSPTFQSKSQAAVVASSWWLSGGIAAANCIAAYQPKGAASYAASKVNLANPGTYDAVDGAEYPTWDASKGWTGNGTSQYLTTGITLDHAYNWSGIIRYSTMAASAYQMFFGWKNNIVADGGNPNGLGKWYFGGTKLGAGAGDGNATWWAGTTSIPSSGVLCKSFLDVYLNGTFVQTITGKGAGIREPYILAANCTNGVGQFTGSTIIAIAIYNIDISSYVSALTTAMAAL